MFRRWRILLQMDVMKSTSQCTTIEIEETKQKVKIKREEIKKNQLLMNCILFHVELKDRVRTWGKSVNLCIERRTTRRHNLLTEYYGLKFDKRDRDATIVMCFCSLSFMSFNLINIQYSMHRCSFVNNVHEFNQRHNGLSADEIVACF